MSIIQNPTHIKRVFLLSLTLIVIILSVLIHFTFTQLEKDSLLRIRENADELILDFNANFIKFIKTEEARSVFDYSAKNLAQIPEQFYRSSSLAQEFPPKKKIFAHFQLSNGIFSSPVYDASYPTDNLKDRQERYNKLLEKLATINIDSFSIPSEYKEDLLSDIKSLKKALRGLKPEIQNAPLPIASKSNKKSSPKLIKIKSKKSKFNPKLNYYLKSQKYDKGKFVPLINTGNDMIFLRKIYVNKNRYLQGFIVSVEDFLNEIILSNFKKRSISEYTWLRLTIGKGRNLFFNGGIKKRTKYYISEPLDQYIPTLKLDLIINEIPRSESTPYFIGIASLCFIIILLGLYFLYQFSLAQMHLAQERSNFVSAVGHEFKTPLTSITMYSEMLKDDMVKDEMKKKAYYQFILEEASRLSRLINNILKLSNITNQRLIAQLEIITTKALLQEVKKKVSPLISLKDYKVIYHDEGLKDLELNVDLDFFTQIILNTIDNALKFSKDATKKEIHIHCETDLDYFTLSIRDFGKGIPAGQEKRVFDLFYRPENELTRTTKGTGIGLALVRELSDKMQGHVYLENQDPGCKFTLKLPIKP